MSGLSARRRIQVMNRKLGWLKEAQGELKAARDLLATKNYSWACFTAQQVGEKALKAVLLNLGKYSPTHNMVDLLKEIAALSRVPPDVIKAGNTLNRYYIPTRVPDSFSSGAPVDQYSEPDATEAIDLAGILYDFARSALGPPGTPSA